MDFDEFVDLVVDHASKVLHEGHHHERRPSLPVVRTEGGEGAEGGEEHTVGEEEEEEEMPEDLRDLPWEKQQFWSVALSLSMSCGLSGAYAAHPLTQLHALHTAHT